MAYNAHSNTNRAVASDAVVTGVGVNLPVISKHNISRTHETLHFDPATSIIYEPYPTRIIAMSDIHLGVRERDKISRKPALSVSDSQANQVVKNAILQSDHVVLNGDIFELYYTDNFSPDRASRPELTDKFIAAIRNWATIAEANNTTIHLVTGNHDDVNELIDRVHNELGGTLPSLCIHPVGLRINDMLFTHGDLLSGRNNKQDLQNLQRTSESEHEYLLGEQLLYKLPEALQKPAGEALLSFKSFIQPLKEAICDKGSVQKNVNKLDKVLQSIPLAQTVSTVGGVMLPPATHIISGHTHNGFDDIQPQHKGNPTSSQRHYHNTGTLINTFQFNPLIIESRGIGNQTVQPVDLLSNVLTAKQQRALDTYRRHHPKAEHALPVSHMDRVNQQNQASWTR